MLFQHLVGAAVAGTLLWFNPSWQQGTTQPLAQRHTLWDGGENQKTPPHGLRQRQFNRIAEEQRIIIIVEYKKQVMDDAIAYHLLSDAQPVLQQQFFKLLSLLALSEQIMYLI